MEQQNNAPEAVSLVEIWRGELVESRHRGHIVAVDGAGENIAALGAPDTLCYLRSSAKPFQALALITSGAADRFNFTEKEIAVACASHNGEIIHVHVVQEMLKKIGLEKHHLKCGAHYPFSQTLTRQMRAANIKPDVLQNNCSGKHAGMLALALQLNAPVETYDAPDHPAQKYIAETIAEFAGVAAKDLTVAVDGCGAPVFAVTVRAAALMYARLVAPPSEWNDELRAACAQIAAAMTHHPFIIGGRDERLDTKIMQAGADGGKSIVSKIGAEGFYTAGVAPSEEYPRGLGIALKIESGEERNARPIVAIETLKQLGVLNETELEPLLPYSHFPVKSHRGETVGEIRPHFSLHRTATHGRS